MSVTQFQLRRAFAAALTVIAVLAATFAAAAPAGAAEGVTLTVTASPASLTLGDTTEVTLSVTATDGGTTPAGFLDWFVAGQWAGSTWIDEGAATKTLTLTPTKTGPFYVVAMFDEYEAPGSAYEVLMVPVRVESSLSALFAPGPYTWDGTTSAQTAVQGSAGPVPSDTPAPTGTVTATGFTGELAVVAVGDVMEFANSRLNIGGGAGIHLEYSGDDHYAPTDIYTQIDVDAVPVTTEIALTDLTVGAGTATVTVVGADGHRFTGGDIVLSAPNITTQFGSPVDGVATIPVAPTSAGEQTFTASYYQSDRRWDTGTATQTAVVAGTPSTTTLSLSGDGEAGEAFDAQACTTAGGVAAAGVMNVSVSNAVDTLEMHSASLNSNGCASFRLNGQKPGPLTVAAEYAGSNDVASSSAQETYEVANYDPTVELRVGRATVPYSHVAPFSVEVVSDAYPLPTGTVTFYIDGVAASTVPLEVYGASYRPTDLPVGAHNVVVTYSGDDQHDPATSAAGTITVVQNAGTLALEVNPTDLSAGQAATLTATLALDEQVFAGSMAAGAPAAAAAVLPGGDVTFHVDGAPVGTATIADGVAELQHTFTGGAHTVTATYNGSAEVAAVTADAVVVAVAGLPVPPALPVPPVAGPPLQDPPVVQGPQAPPTPATSPAVGPAAAPDAAADAAGALVHTGSNAATLVPLAAVLLLAGALISASARRARRRDLGR